MPFFSSKTCSQLQQLGTPPHSAVCVGFERTFFFRNPTFSGVFEKNNIRMIENVFMHYFFSSLAIYRDRGKKVDNVFFADTYDVPGVFRYIWRTIWLKNLKVWTKSFRMVSSGALCDKISLLWFSADLSDFEWKSSIFEIWKFWRNFFIFYQKLARTDTSGFLTYRTPKGIVGKLLVYTFEFSKL